ncbi:MAG: transposase, partial [Wenzhouxiangellaceae bacterium]|nr:transposase [Wenzhouxiangellaceae bacterium]
MELTAIYPTSIGLDVHQRQISACAITSGPDGQVTAEHRQFGSFKRDRRALAEWCASKAPDVVVMESTGIYWKSPYTALERVGIRALVVNA